MKCPNCGGKHVREQKHREVVQGYCYACGYVWEDPSTKESLPLYL